MLSLLTVSATALDPPFDVGVDDEVVDHRGEHVGEQDRQHDAFGKRRVDHANDVGQESDQQAVDKPAGFGLCCRNRKFVEDLTVSLLSWIFYPDRSLPVFQKYGLCGF